MKDPFLWVYRHQNGFLAAEVCSVGLCGYVVLYAGLRPPFMKKCHANGTFTCIAGCLSNRQRLLVHEDLNVRDKNVKQERSLKLRTSGP